jgi:hypothetical protein
VREDVAPGCPERFDFAFLRWAWTYKSEHAAKYRLALDSYAPHADVKIFADTRDAEMFIETLRR